LSPFLNLEDMCLLSYWVPTPLHGQMIKNLICDKLHVYFSPFLNPEDVCLLLDTHTLVWANYQNPQMRCKLYIWCLQMHLRVHQHYKNKNRQANKQVGGWSPGRVLSHLKGTIKQGGLPCRQLLGSGHGAGDPTDMLQP